MHAALMIVLCIHYTLHTLHFLHDVWRRFALFSRFKAFSLIPPHELDLTIARKVMPLSFIYVLMLAFNNLCLQYVEVTFYQVIANSFAWTFIRMQLIDWLMIMLISITSLYLILGCSLSHNCFQHHLHLHSSRCQNFSFCIMRMCDCICWFRHWLVWWTQFYLGRRYLRRSFQCICCVVWNLCQKDSCRCR